jgi:ATP-dependent DNA helicase RecG
MREGVLSPKNYSPFPKNPSIAKFLMQLGRFDELGSGILNVNKYIKAYSGKDNPQFIEGTTFKTIIPVQETFLEQLTEFLSEFLLEQLTEHFSV